MVKVISESGVCSERDKTIIEASEKCFVIIYEAVDKIYPATDENNMDRINLHKDILLNIFGNGIMQVTTENKGREPFDHNAYEICLALAEWFQRVISLKFKQDKCND